jgi:hypothetical protein
LNFVQKYCSNQSDGYCLNGRALKKQGTEMKNTLTKTALILFVASLSLAACTDKKAETAGEKLDAGMEMSKEKLEDAGEKTEELYEDAKSSSAEAYEDAKDASVEAYEGAKGSTVDAYEKAKDKAMEMKTDVENSMEDECVDGKDKMGRDC